MSPGGFDIDVDTVAISCVHWLSCADARSRVYTIRPGRTGLETHGFWSRSTDKFMAVQVHNVSAGCCGTLLRQVGHGVRLAVWRAESCCELLRAMAPHFLAFAFQSNESLFAVVWNCNRLSNLFGFRLRNVTRPIRARSPKHDPSIVTEITAIAQFEWVSRAKRAVSRTHSASISATVAR